MRRAEGSQYAHVQIALNWPSLGRDSPPLQKWVGLTCALALHQAIFLSPGSAMQCIVLWLLQLECIHSKMSRTQNIASHTFFSRLKYNNRCDAQRLYFTLPRSYPNLYLFFFHASVWPNCRRSPRQILLSDLSTLHHQCKRQTLILLRLDRSFCLVL